MICIMVVSLYHVHLCSSNYQHGRYIKTVKRICTLGLRDKIENLYESSCNHIFNRCVQLMRFSLPLDWSYSSFPNHACNSPRYIFLSLPHDITATEKGISMKLGWLWTFSLWCKQLQLNGCVGKDPKWHMIDSNFLLENSFPLLFTNKEEFDMRSRVTPVAGLLLYSLNIQINWKSIMFNSIPFDDSQAPLPLPQKGKVHCSRLLARIWKVAVQNML